jgi:hypothetical protein
MGRLHRLFTYARSTYARPLENFTTEALAAAVQEHPEPFARALAEIGVVPRDFATVTTTTVSTQQGVGDGGIVDLIVTLRVDGTSIVVWAEVKAHAGLHGAQLDTYRGVITRHVSEPRPKLVMIAKRALADDVPILSWNRLRDHIRRDHAPHLYWRDLCEFLEAEGMADDFDLPVAVTEMSIANAAHGLLRKAVRIAREFVESEELATWRACEFPQSEAKVAACIQAQFYRHKRMVLTSGRYPWVSFGITFYDRPQLEIWIEFQGNDVDAREAVFARAKELPPGWTLVGAERWPYIGASRWIESDLTQHDAITWLHERVHELDRSGVLAQLPKWRRRDRIGAEDTNGT